MRPGTKAAAYIRRMISTGKWENTIPSSAKIAEKIQVSIPTVRSAVKTLEAQHLLENNGSLGYSIVPKKFSELLKTNKQLYYLAMISKNLRIASLLSKGGKILGNFVFLVAGQSISVANIASGDVLNTSLYELEEMAGNPVTIDSLLKLKGKQLSKARIQFLKQKRMNSIPDLVITHRRELGL